MSSQLNHGRALLFGAGLLMALASSAAADSGINTTLPTGATVPGGLQLRLECRWAGGSGYHPVWVSIDTSPPTPSMSERSFRLEFEMRGPLMQEPATVSQYMEIHQNQTGGKALVLVPQSQLWTSMNLTVYEDGVRLPNLSRSLGMQGWGINQVTEAQPAAVFISSNAPLMNDRQAVINQALSNGNRTSTFPPPHEYSSLFNSMNSSQRGDAIALQSLAADHLATLRHPTELPTKWQAYTSTDVVFLELADWKDLEQSAPDAAKALKRWIRWGGNLVVFDVQPGDHQALLASVGADPVRTRDSQLPNRGSLDRRVLMPQAEERVLPPRQTGPNRINSLEAAVGMGQVLGIDLSQSEARSRTYANALNAIDTNRWKWYRRMGISNVRDGSDYSTHNIPGVGEPPLLTFLASITLFVIVIGPFNYLLLKRWRRLYLLLVTVPAGATLVTAAIFISAIVGDGLGVKVLHRSFTDLDQLEGQAATWNRQTYYAGMAPRELVFPESAGVFPIINPVVDRTQVRERTLHWDEAGQHYGDGYLSSRRMDQFLVTNSGPTTAKLAITPAKGALTAKNELGAEVRFLIATDNNGASFFVENLGMGVEAELAKLESTTFVQFQQRIADADPRRRNNPAFMRPTYYRTYQLWNLQNQLQQMDGGEPPPDSRSSLMERGIAETMAFLPRNGHYYAILSTCPWAEAGCRSRELPQGLHVVRGRWQ